MDMTPLSPDVFISYNHLSVNLVEKIALQLEKEKINCWYAPRNLDDEGAGELYDDIIAKTIPKVSVVVVIVTDSALASKWVKMEVTMADDMGKSVIPFEIAPTNIINGLTSRLAIRHKIVAYPNPEEKIEQLIKNVKRKLNEVVSLDKDHNNRQHYFEVDKNVPIVDFDFDEGEALYSMKEYAEATLPYLKSAIQGNNRAKDRLCSIFYHLDNPKIISKDIWEIIEPQAEEGHCYACFLMSCKYHNNPETNSLAFDYLKKSIRTNTIPLALLRIGIYYGWGMGVKQSSILSMLYYRKAIDAGCKEAYSYLGTELINGNDKYEADKEKGLMFLKKGAELYDKRSMSRLAREYMSSVDTIDLAREVANNMIEQEYYEGYCLLGDACWSNLTATEDFSNDIKKQTKDYYLEAIKRDVASAYGNLSWFYYYFDNDETEAIRMAQRGRDEGDSFSLYMLGTIQYDNGVLYEKQKEIEKADDYYEKAWQNFEERYDKYGIGSVDLGKILLDYPKNNDGDDNTDSTKLHFTPNKYKKNKAADIINKIKGDSIVETLQDDLIVGLIDLVIQKLEVEAHQGNIEAIIYLLRLNCFKIYGDSTLNYNIINDAPQTASFLAFGANKGANSEMTFYYGKSLMDYERFPTLYKPIKGLSLVENAANKKNAEALNYLVERYGNNDDDELFFIRAKEAIDEMVLSKDNFKYISRILSHSTEDDKYIIDIEKIRSLVDGNIRPNDARFFKSLGNSLNVLCPNFDDNKIFSNFKSSSKIEQWLFYSKYYANDKEVDTDIQDDFMERLHSLLKFDDSLMQDDSNYNADIKDLIQAMNNYQKSYIAVCEKKGITPLEYSLPQTEYQFPYMPSSVCAKISFDTFNLFLNLQDTIPEIYEPILPILRSDEQMLNYVETLGSDQDLQLFLIELIEIRIDIESIMLDNYTLYKNFKENKNAIVKYLNDILVKYGEKVTSKETTYTVDNLPDLAEITPTRAFSPSDFYENAENKGTFSVFNKQEESDEFERLLNEFINSSTKEIDSQQ